MGFLDNSTITVDAILTKRGREILSQGGNFKITKLHLVMKKLIILYMIQLIQMEQIHMVQLLKIYLC